MTPERLARALREADPGGDLRDADGQDAVAGVLPRLVARPTTVDGVAAVLREARAQGLATLARGGGTALDWAAPPRRLDVVLDTTGLDRLVEHTAGDLVAVGEGGLPVGRLLDVVGEHGQELVVDLPPARRDGGSTIGGALSTGMSGPRRLQRGALRDLVLGATVVLADGTIATSGGKVVKNVAGYDLAKLMTGAFGTLGVIVRAAFRLHPTRPERRWVVATGPIARVASRARDVVASQLAPAAVEIDRPAGSDTATAAVLLEGSRTAVGHRAAGAATVLGGLVRTTPPPWWGVLPGDEASVLAKATATLPGVADLLDAARRAELEHGTGVALRGTAAGVLHVAIGTSGAGTSGTRSEADAVRAVVRDLRRAAATAGDGTVVVLRAPSVVRDGLDVWGPVGGLGLMRAVKQRLDPGGNLAPGRFVGGI